MRARFPLTVAALAVAVLAGCDARSVKVDIDPAKITYARDARTGICTGAVGRAAGNSMTDTADSFSVFAVPCSPEVLALVSQAQGGTAGRRR